MKQETKEAASRLWDDVKEGLEKGYNASKVGLKKAGEAIQKFSDKSVVTVELKKYESKLNKAYAALGQFAAKKLSAKNASPLSAEDAEVAEMLKEIASLSKEVSKREKLLKEQESGTETPAGKKTVSKKAK